MKEWRLVWVRTPWLRVDEDDRQVRGGGPVTMLRVYCSWPGVSARMKWRFGVEK